MKYTLLFIALFFYSCNTLKQDNKRFNAIEARHPALVAQKLNTLFPPTTPTVIQGKPVITIVHVHDTVITNKIVKTIDSIFLNVVDIDSLRRAVINETLRDCGTFDDTSSMIHDTLIQIPSTILVQIKSLQDDSVSNSKTITQLTTSNTIYKSQYDKWLLYFIILSIAVGVYTILKIYFKFKP